MTEPMQMCALHPVSWREKRHLGYPWVLSKCGRHRAADLDLIFTVEITWPLIPNRDFSSTSFITAGRGHQPR